MKMCPSCGLPSNVCLALSLYNKALLTIVKEEDMPRAVDFFMAAIRAERSYYEEHEHQITGTVQ